MLDALHVVEYELHVKSKSKELHLQKQRSVYLHSAMVFAAMALATVPAMANCNSLPECHQRIEQLTEQASLAEKRLAEKDRTIADLDKALVERNKTIAEKDKTLIERSKEVADKARDILERETRIVELKAEAGNGMVLMIALALLGLGWLWLGYQERIRFQTKPNDQLVIDQLKARIVTDEKTIDILASLLRSGQPEEERLANLNRMLRKAGELQVTNARHDAAIAKLEEQSAETLQRIARLEGDASR